MKTKLFALIALLLAGVCHAQTTTISAGGTYKNGVYTNTDPNKYAIVINTTQEVILQNATITSAGGGITAGINGLGVTNVALEVKGGTHNCTSSSTGKSFLYLGSPQFVVLQNATLSGPWLSPFSLSSLTPTPPLTPPVEVFTVAVIGNTFGSGCGAIYLQNMDTGLYYEGAEITNNTWLAPSNQAVGTALIMVQNQNLSTPSFYLDIAGNTWTPPGFGQPSFNGSIANLIGTFESITFAAGESGDQVFTSSSLNN